MRVYVVMVAYIKYKYERLSQEGYSTLEKAQDFCLNRAGNVQKIDEMTFVDEKREYGYHIHEILIK